MLIIAPLAMMVCASVAAAAIRADFAITIHTGTPPPPPPPPPPPSANSIRPGDGHVLNALGHTWSFCPVQDWFGGYCVMRDGKPTSDHGVLLEWDGSTLTVTWHHPYPFDPNTGFPWTPPLFSKTVRADASYISGVEPQNQPRWKPAGAP